MFPAGTDGDGAQSKSRTDTPSFDDKDQHHRFLKAADGGILEALRTGTKVVSSTTNHPPKNNISVLAHGNENAAPSASHTAL